MIDNPMDGTILPPPAHFSDRKHRLAPPKSFWGRTTLALQDGLESFVAKVSLNGDPQIYEVKTFPWAAELEADWKKIRVELDQVMQYRDQIPSFQDILKEVSAIQTD
ncbi:MAG TPA: aspartyl/asparaginyl beta-hydroxylase domain-containing protein, partial [Verrucomicrobiae bacterium]